MNDNQRGIPSWLPAAGCLTITLAGSLMCLLPIFLVDLLKSALEKLHLASPVAGLLVMAILLGGFINLPIKKIERNELQPVALLGVLGSWAWAPGLRRYRPDTVVAVNVGGCLIPLGIVAWELVYLAGDGSWILGSLLVATLVNIGICYYAARPVPGVGILLPTFVSPLVAVLSSAVLLAWGDFASARAPVAFVAGVLGPVIGADLLHLRDLGNISSGLVSIGGAGTFDGIVISGVLAALLA